MSSKTEERGVRRSKCLLVGINDYKPIGTGGADLRGCVNDVKDMANTLVICGFSPINFRVITDSRATKAGILDGLKWLVRGARPGDSIVFYYSGHGSYMVDASGDEPDGKDELLCPHDWPNYISDDDLGAIFRALPPGVNLEVILDSCHSGTATKSVIVPLNSNGQPLDTFVTSRYLEPPYDFTVYDDFKVDYKRKVKKLFGFEEDSNTREIRPSASMNHVLWAGCRDKQTSKELNISGQIRGAFTYHFCKILKATNGVIVRSRMDSLVTAGVRRTVADQDTQLEATRLEISNRVFF